MKSAEVRRSYLLAKHLLRLLFGVRSRDKIHHIVIRVADRVDAFDRDLMSRAVGMSYCE